ncbi:hypothetical protein BJ742DRAFT_856456 [Cladochytrium replicatum]|nr:hypothetical protein BJ742DRAFT_856456 [Cladochytrium replicatum]
MSASPRRSYNRIYDIEAQPDPGSTLQSTTSLARSTNPPVRNSTTSTTSSAGILKGRRRGSATPSATFTPRRAPGSRSASNYASPIDLVQLSEVDFRSSSRRGSLSLSRGNLLPQPTDFFSRGNTSASLYKYVRPLWNPSSSVPNRSNIPSHLSLLTTDISEAFTPSQTTPPPPLPQQTSSSSISTTSTCLPHDTKQVALLLRLARALILFGAPSYRAEVRVTAIAERLGIPFSLFVLPGTLWVSFGDGSDAHPGRSFCISTSNGGIALGKLQEVDRIAKRAVRLKCIEEDEWEDREEAKAGGDALKEDVEDEEERDCEASSRNHKEPVDLGETMTLRQSPISETENVHDSHSVAEEDLDDLLLALDAILTDQPRPPPSTNPAEPPDVISDPLVDERREAGLSSHPEHRSHHHTDTPKKPHPPPPPPDSSNHRIHYILSHLAVRAVASASQSALITATILGGSPADVLVSFLLGALCIGGLEACRIMDVAGIAEMVVGFGVSFVARVMQGLGVTVWTAMNRAWWEGTSVSVALGGGAGMVDKWIAPGVCQSLVTIAGALNLMPGFMITLGMLELSRGRSVAGAVRMLLALLSSIRIGFGLAMGARSASWIFSSARNSDQTDQALTSFAQSYSPDNSASDAWATTIASIILGNTINNTSQVTVYGSYKDWSGCFVGRSFSWTEFWRLPLFLPLQIAIFVMLKAYPRMWPSLFLVSFVAFLTSTIASDFLGKEAGTVLSALALGTMSNLIARTSDDIAVGGIFVGIFWLVPGSIGVSGAARAISAMHAAKDKSASSEEASSIGSAAYFGVDMLTRAMSIAVGLFLSNSLVGPMVGKGGAELALV